MTCTHGCTKILYDDDADCDYYELINIKYDELNEFKCTNPIIEGEYGDINPDDLYYAWSSGLFERVSFYT